MKKNNQWFSILVWMFLIIILTLSAYVILSYIIPFSQNTKWIENASRAYYYAYWGIESSLLDVKTSSTNTPLSLPASTSTWYYSLVWKNWNLNPPLWKGNSDINTDYNKIWPNFPVQMEVWNNLLAWNISNVKMFLRVPAFTWWTLIFDATWPIINWSLSSTWNTLNATDYITQANIKNSITDYVSSSSNNFVFSSKNWKNLEESNLTFQSFYSGNCINNSCILKLSVINPLKAKLSSWTSYDIPYLEYKIDFWGASIPLYYTNIDASWKSYWFKKDLKVRVPQQTLNQAFDFTVFQ